MEDVVGSEEHWPCDFVPCLAEINAFRKPITFDCAPMVEVGVTFEERHDFLQLHLLAMTFLATWTIFTAVEAHVLVPSVLPRRPDHLLKHTRAHTVDEIPITAVV